MNIRYLRNCIKLILIQLLLISSLSAQQLDGFWNGHNWGDIVIVGDVGVYSDSHSFAYGALEFKPDGEGLFKGIWAEPVGRSGPFEIRLLADGTTITGTYTTDSSIRFGHPSKHGKIYWTKEERGAKRHEILSRLRLDIPELRRYLNVLEKMVADDANQSS